jgi:SAM-dependent methyltransferase
MPVHDRQPDAPSPWVRRWAGLIRPGGRVLDVACGNGRHLRYLRERGYSVLGVDRDASALAELQGLDGIEVVIADIESGPWPFSSTSFDAVLVTNYLHRPRVPALIAALERDGVLIYETFAEGNERFGRPSNPAFLLRRNELLERFGSLSVIAFEQGVVGAPKPAMTQRICAVREAAGPQRLDGP